MLGARSVILLMFVCSTLSQNTGSTITASTCASPDGFTSCFQQVAASTTKCNAQAGSDNSQRLACGCQGAISEIGCALANCWNVVYGCEYQTLANQVVRTCIGRNIPFFPAPENAPGACSCNLGNVIYNMTAVETQYTTCVRQSSLDVTRLTACGCCDAAGQYTSKFSVCPNTDPTLNGYTSDLNLLQIRFPLFNQCGSVFRQYNCVRDLAFPPIGSFSYLSALPASTGSAKLSTLQGTISTPLSGSTFTFTASWSQVVSTTVITAAGMAKSTAGPGSSGSGSGSGSQNAASTGARPQTLGAVLVAGNFVVVLLRTIMT